MDTKDRFKMYFRSNTKGLANGLDVEMREEKQEWLIDFVVNNCVVTHDVFSPYIESYLKLILTIKKGKKVLFDIFFK